MQILGRVFVKSGWIFQICHSIIAKEKRYAARVYGGNHENKMFWQKVAKAVDAGHAQE